MGVLNSVEDFSESIFAVLGFVERGKNEVYGVRDHRCNFGFQP